MPRTIVVHHSDEQNPAHHENPAHPDPVNTIDPATLIAEFRAAIELEQLVLHYQPKATLVSERVEAVEALVCWRHPRLGLLHPDRFLPLVEQTDLIDQLTKWVLRQALNDLRGLGHRAEHVTMAVNVFARNLSGPGFAGLVESELTRAQISPHRLVVEITEAALLSDPEGVREILARLDTHGVNVSIDDFGSGATSLAYLSTLPIRELKIDQRFIGDMLVNPSHAAIVRSIVDLGHDLQLRVVGEGVESDVVWEILRALGCDSAQGYVLARPMPVEQLGHWLENSAHESYGLVENAVLVEHAVFADHG